ncbi:tRNA threonylcarbamoyladenosine dehydratase [Heliorestis acidaminivorans]|uniref:tRNA threonylcarbamoyladenosine dehydratase n=1 Tax=Heliorestis acidaminivorans TaxID=553427 RepID=A0A6I0EXG1_9FIRM|nr:tRNA threonylcarbamoyladenosine dehydratase [Heliorestis acidaminivorans]KAB2951267.1 tRNA threonylcarbamoyladenosine dehydratase [Heliorestis acidaminivorans]
MKQHLFSRSELLIGPEGLATLNQATVAVFGLGGVGSYTAEALARSGVGHLVLIDHDDICLTNINRQLHALHSTVGRPKIEVMAERLQDINPKLKLTLFRRFYGVETGEEIITEKLDYVVDAIDTVKGKLQIIELAKALHIPVISALGAGNKLDPTQLKVTDIYKTSIDPLAKVIRKELRRRGIKDLKVVYSTEKPLKPQGENACKSQCVCPNPEEPFGATCLSKRQIPGSIAFVPPVAGLMMASVVVRDLLTTGKKTNIIKTDTP